MPTRTSTALRRAATGLLALAFAGAGMGAWTGSATGWSAAASVAANAAGIPNSNAAPRVMTGADAVGTH